MEIHDNGHRRHKYHYTEPPADTTLLIAQEDLEINARVDKLCEIINLAMESCTEQQQFVYRKVTGVMEDGTQEDGWTDSEIARAIGVTRSHVRRVFLEAENRVLRSIVGIVVPLIPSSVTLRNGSE